MKSQNCCRFRATYTDAVPLCVCLFTLCVTQCVYINGRTAFYSVLATVCANGHIVFYKICVYAVLVFEEM